MIHVDVSKFSQVLRNLLSNALKFTPREGHVSVELELLRKEMETKLAMLEAQLEAERRRNKLDFSNLDDKIRSEYAKRWAGQP